MFQQRLPLQNLFTFGCGQLQACLSQQRKNKFPFLLNTKLKKTPMLQKLISQQRAKVIQDNQNIDLNLPKNFKTRAKSINFQNRKISFTGQKKTSLIKNDIANLNKSQQKRKVSLPKVLKNVFPQPEGNIIYSRKIMSAHPSIRYLGQQQFIELVKPFNPCENNLKQDTIRENRAQSVMLLSQNCQQIQQQKIRTIQHKRNRIFSKAFKSKTQYKSKIEEANKKICQNINQLKKKYL